MNTYDENLIFRLKTSLYGLLAAYRLAIESGGIRITTDQDLSMLDRLIREADLYSKLEAGEEGLKYEQ